MLIQTLKSGTNLPNKIKITYLLLILEILQLAPVQQYFNIHGCEMMINVLFLYNIGLLTLLHQCTTTVTEKCLI